MLGVTESLSNRGKLYLGNNVNTFNVLPQAGNVVCVRLWVDDANYVQSPADFDESTQGIVVEADCPYAYQAVADAVLTSLQSTNYSPYVADVAEIEPAAEIGDGLTSNGVYSGIYTFSKNFSRRSVADVSAPVNTETQHEFQYTDADERRFMRQAKQVSEMGSELALKMDKIYAQVTGSGQTFGWELTSTGMNWKSNRNVVMSLTPSGLQINGSLYAQAVITGSINLGGDTIDAGTLRSGAQWPFNSYNSSYTNGGYSLTGGGYGFNFNTASTQYTTSYPSYFRCGMLQLSDNSVFSSSIRVTINGTPYRLIGFVTT